MRVNEKYAHSPGANLLSIFDSEGHKIEEILDAIGT